MDMGTQRRKQRQSGQEIVEFGLVLVLFVPLLLGAVATGMGMVQSIQTNSICRDLDDMYIHGADFSTYSMQQMAQRLAQGMNLQIGSSFSGNKQANTSNGGNGIVMVSQIMWVGGATSPNCQSVGASNCANANSFVFTQRIEFGNSTLKTTTNNTLGDPTTTNISSQGIVFNPNTDSGAKLSNPGQTNMQSLWQSGANGTTALVDGQVVYVVETYFKNSMTFGSFSPAGTYARYFF
jgi:hypothetical protein